LISEPHDRASCFSIPVRRTSQDAGAYPATLPSWNEEFVVSGRRGSQQKKGPFIGGAPYARLLERNPVGRFVRSSRLGSPCRGFRFLKVKPVHDVAAHRPRRELLGRGLPVLLIFLAHLGSERYCSRSECLHSGREPTDSSAETGKAEAAKLPGAAMSANRGPRDCAVERGRVPDSTRIDWQDEERVRVERKTRGASCFRRHCLAGALGPRESTPSSRLVPRRGCLLRKKVRARRSGIRPTVVRENRFVEGKGPAPSVGPVEICYPRTKNSDRAAGLTTACQDRWPIP
jgi:hypothetical protein